MQEEGGYGSHEEGMSPRQAEESDSSDYSEMEAEIFDKLNQSKSRKLILETSLTSHDDKKAVGDMEKMREDATSPMKRLISKKSSSMETGAGSPVKKKASMKPPVATGTKQPAT